MRTRLESLLVSKGALPSTLERMTASLLKHYGYKTFEAEYEGNPIFVTRFDDFTIEISRDHPKKGGIPEYLRGRERETVLDYLFETVSS